MMDLKYKNLNGGEMTNKMKLPSILALIVIIFLSLSAVSASDSGDSITVLTNSSDSAIDDTIAISNSNNDLTESFDDSNLEIDDSNDLDDETVTDNNDLKFLNNKGLVERDHKTKKDTFYLYKAEWSSEKFVHICQKNYTKTHQGKFV